MLTIRVARPDDHDAIWSILEAIIRVADTYTLSPDMSREAALSYWFSPKHEVFVAEDNGVILGTYFLRSNQEGGGAHVANCGYMTAPSAAGRGVASSMCVHSIERARARNFRAMQFNFVIGSNDRVVRLWQKHGFETVGRLPKRSFTQSSVILTPYVMYRER